jgi:hypothetical protein
MLAWQTRWKLVGDRGRSRLRLLQDRLLLWQEMLL